MAKVPGQRPSGNDISKATRDQIMREIDRAQKADHCTETKRNGK